MITGSSLESDISHLRHVNVMKNPLDTKYANLVNIFKELVNTHTK